MDQQAHPTKTTLPGIGTRYDLTTESGKHVSVVVRNDGRRFIGFHDPQDDDACKDSVTLGPGEAASLAQLLIPADRPGPWRDRDRPGHRAHPDHGQVAVRGSHTG